MIDVNDFLNLTEDKKQEIRVRYGKIPADYTSGRPTVLLDGATVPTVRKYPYLGSYTPAKNDRVMILNGVILGKIV